MPEINMAAQKNKIFWEKNAFEKWSCVTKSNENVNLETFLGCLTLVPKNVEFLVC